MVRCALMEEHPVGLGPQWPDLVVIPQAKIDKAPRRVRDAVITLTCVGKIQSNYDRRVIIVEMNGLDDAAAAMFRKLGRPAQAVPEPAPRQSTGLTAEPFVRSIEV